MLASRVSRRPLKEGFLSSLSGIFKRASRPPRTIGELRDVLLENLEAVFVNQAKYSLYICNEPVLTEGALALALFLLSPNVPSISNLSLAACGITEVEDFANLLKGTTIVSLNLQGNEVKDFGFEHILFQLHDHLESLNLSGCRITKINAGLLESCLFLQTLSLSENDLGSTGIEVIFRCLRNHLISLDVSSCNIASLNPDILADCLKLTRLEICSNDIKEFGFNTILSSLSSTLSALRVSYCGIEHVEFELLFRCKMLNELDLSGNKIMDEGLQTVLRALSHQIIKLSVSNCEIRNINQEELIKCLKLMDLDVSNNSINDSGLDIILNSLYKQIQTLNIENCSINKFPIGPFVKCQELKSLTIGSDGGLVTRQQTKILEAYKKMPAFQEINPLPKRVAYLIHSHRFKVVFLLCSVSLERIGCRSHFKMFPKEIVRMIANVYSYRKKSTAVHIPMPEDFLN